MTDALAQHKGILDVVKGQVAREAGRALGAFRIADEDLPSAKIADLLSKLSPEQQPIQEVELWDLVSAFSRVLKAKHAVASPESIRYDETPIHVYMQRIDERLRARSSIARSSAAPTPFRRQSLSGISAVISRLPMLVGVSFQLT